MTDAETTRRGIVRLAGGALVVALAGCSSPGGEDEGGDEENGEENGEGDEEDDLEAPTDPRGANTDTGASASR